MRLDIKYSGSKEYERVFNIDLVESDNMKVFKSMNYSDISSLFSLNTTITLQDQTYIVKSFDKSVVDKEFFVSITLKNINDNLLGDKGTSSYNFTYLANR